MGSTIVELGEEVTVVVWKRGVKHGTAIAHLLAAGSRGLDCRIEVVDGEVDSVVRVRIEAVRPDRYVGWITDAFDRDSEEWQEARRVLRTQYDFEAEVVERREETRLTIRSSDDYHVQWLEHKRRLFQRIGNRAQL